MTGVNMRAYDAANANCEPRSQISVNFFLLSLRLRGTNPCCRRLANVAKCVILPKSMGLDMSPILPISFAVPSLCSGSDRLGVIPADPVCRRGPLGYCIGVLARSLELPGSAGQERGRANSSSFCGRIVKTSAWNPSPFRRAHPVILRPPASAGLEECSSSRRQSHAPEASCETPRFAGPSERGGGWRG